MTGWAALLRAVNVGGTGKLPMAQLKTLCEELGLERVRTYIASGNVLFASERDESALKAALEAALARQYGKPIEVLVRSAADMARVAAANPWPDRPGNRVAVIFCEVTPSLDGVTGQRGEVVALGQRELFVDYADGMADTKLRIPCAKLGTARNMNTVAKLAELAAAAGAS